MKAYRHRFTLVGAWAFPLDMLRYDQCYPVDTGSVHQAECGGNNKPIILEHVGERDWKPTTARWASFGFMVTSHEVHKID